MRKFISLFILLISISTISLAQTQQNTFKVKSGYQGKVSLGYAIGVGDVGWNISLNRLRFHLINGYRFGPHFYLGFGTGVHYYPSKTSVREGLASYGEGQSVIPLFADFTGYFLKNGNSPFIEINIGNSFNASQSFNSIGLFFNPALGASIAISERRAINLSIGYALQKESYFSFKYSAITANLGFTF
jgi:hypothetical protein